MINNYALNFDAWGVWKLEFGEGTGTQPFIITYGLNKINVVFLIWFVLHYTSFYAFSAAFGFAYAVTWSKILKSLPLNWRYVHPVQLRHLHIYSLAQQAKGDQMRLAAVDNEEETIALATLTLKARLQPEALAQEVNLFAPTLYINIYIYTCCNDTSWAWTRSVPSRDNVPMSPSGERDT